MKKILVVEDEDSVRENIIEMLNNEEFEPVEAKDGEEGFKMALSAEPDLIISDIRMPKLDGLELLKKLQSNSSTAQIPFIFLTAKVEMQDLRAGMSSGADDYLIKPFNYDDLLTAVNTRLRKKENYMSVVRDFKDLLLKRVPHELRTPLVGILGLSDIMRENIDNLSKEELLEAANIIHRSGRRLHRRIEKFIAFSELLPQNNFGNANGTQKSFELLAGQISSDLKLKAGEFDRHEDIFIQFEYCVLKITRAEYEVVLNELLENSLKFSNKGTRISITGKSVDNFYVTQIIDNGRGINTSESDKIELFNQFNKKSTEEGLGLGLSIVKSVVENHGGKIKFSGLQDKGTIVEFTIPLAN